MKRPLRLCGIVGWAGVVGVLTPALLSGCAKETPSSASNETAAVAEAAPALSSEETSAAEPESAAPQTETAVAPSPAQSEPEERVDEAVAEAKDAQPPAEALPVEVVLGDESLLAGVPGEGPLTVEEIKTWLDTPGVHEPLSVSLPLGLSLGEQQITGLDENPMTRAKIELGRQLYFDPRLSSDYSISCASCHDPSHGFAAATQFGVGVAGQTGNRNSPVSYNRILSGAQFWDGRAATLEEQAVGPIANPIEMSSSHDACVECLNNIEGYKIQFERIFGAEPITIDHVGQALASFERAIVTGPSPYDYHAALKPFLEQFSEDDLADLKEDDPETYAKYADVKAQAEAHPMSESAIRGMELFFSDRVGCTACHVGANFTDEKYHNLGVGMDREEPDLGRFVVTGEEKDKGAFKTPTIRNVALSPPYMHDGSQKTLLEVVEWYAKGGHPNPWLSDKVKKFEATDQDKQDLVAFMEALTGPFPTIQSGRLPE